VKGQIHKEEAEERSKYDREKKNVNNNIKLALV